MIHKKTTIYFFLTFLSLSGIADLNIFSLNAGMPPYKTTSKPVYMTISLIWQTEHLTQYDIDTLGKFREEFSSISVHHFISPELLMGEHKKRAIEKMESVIKDEDHIGLLLGPGKKALNQLQIKTPRSADIWGGASSKTEGEVFLNAFEGEDLIKLAALGKETIEEAFGKKVQTVMTSDWTDSLKIAYAVERVGIPYNFSAIAPILLKGRLAGFPIYKELKRSWQEVTLLKGPFVKEDAPTIYVPQSAGSVDYLTSQDLVNLFLNQSRKPKNHKMVFHTSLHVKTMQQTLKRLSSALQEIFAISMKSNIHIKPLPKNLSHVIMTEESKEGAL